MILPQRILGSTELKVSAVGLGTTKLGRNTNVKYPHNFEIPDNKQVLNLLAMAQDLNINLIDTAPSYGIAENRLGQLLQGQRQKWIIIGKAGEDYENQQSSYNFTKEHILESIKCSLKRLRTDYIDMLLIHSDGDDENIINNYDVFGTLSLAKKQGLIRYYGMSTKTVAGGLLTLKHSDAAMIMYNPINIEELPVITAAHEMRKGILIKKSLASGHIDKINNENPVQAAMDFIFKEPGVGSVIFGTINQQHLKTNTQCVSNVLMNSNY